MTKREPYLNPHQARDREPDAYQNLLGDAIERCYAAGVHDLAGLVEQLNELQRQYFGADPQRIRDDATRFLEQMNEKRIVDY